MIRKKVAILIFAQSAKREASQKKLGRSVALFKELNRQTISTAQKTGLPYYVCSEKEQEGTHFGERFTNALSAIYAKGYDQIIAIGNDTPHLNANHLLAAQEQLATAPIVIGPSTDGGFYLLGLHKSHFVPRELTKLPWQSSQLSEVLIHTLSHQNTHTHTLESLSDIDTEIDLKKILNDRHLLPQKVLQLIRDLLSKQTACISQYVQRTFTPFSTLFFNKGSPLPTRFS